MQIQSEDISEKLPPVYDILHFLTGRDVIKRAVVGKYTVLFARFLKFYVVVQRNNEDKSKTVIVRTQDVKRAASIYVETCISYL